MSISLPEPTSAFLNRHRELLARERDEEIKRSHLLLSTCSQRLLEQKGLAITSLTVSAINIGLGGNYLVELERPSAYHSSSLFPPHTLRTGDLARISLHKTGSGSTKKASKSKKEEVDSEYDGVIYKISDTRVIIALDRSDTSGTPEFPDRCTVVKVVNSTTYDRMEKALDDLEKAAQGAHSASRLSDPLVRVLLGHSPPSPLKSMDSLDFYDQNLNQSQKDAVRFCLAAPEVACIHGPPGTGKTHTLVEIIRQLTAVAPPNADAKRILVCGASNLSVDNILERLITLPAREPGAKLKFTRIGHPARVIAKESVIEATLEVQTGRSDQAILAKDVKNELEETLAVLSGKGKGKKPKGEERRKMWEDVKLLRKEYRQRESSVVKSVLSEAQVVLATCHSAGSWQLKNMVFDVVIIDEATQALEAVRTPILVSVVPGFKERRTLKVCWIPILKAKKLILAGDPMQLPPTILSLDKHEKKSTTRQKQKTQSEKAVSPTSTESTGSIAPHQPPHLDPEHEDEGSASELEERVKNANSNKNDSPSRSELLNKGYPRELRPPGTLETTLFDRLEKMYGPGIKRMLTVQYRMHEQICDFPSKTLYSSNLLPDPAVATHLLSDLPNVQAELEDDEALKLPVVFFDTSGCEYFERLEGDNDEGSRCNENEVTIVKNWITELISHKVAPSQIAVITPYQAQVTLLTSLLRPLFGESLEIGTVDGMQGREKEAVIISLVRSNDQREVGFLRDQRRLNVAMTRARRHLCVVGDSSTINHGGNYLKSWIGWLEENADVRYGGLD